MTKNTLHQIIICNCTDVNTLSTRVISVQNPDFVGFVVPAIKKKDSRLGFVGFVSPAIMFKPEKDLENHKQNIHWPGQ